MTVRRIRWAATLSVVLGLAGAGSGAENVTWHAVAPPAAVGAGSSSSPAPVRSDPAATLGRPVPLSASDSAAGAASADNVAPAAFPNAQESNPPGVIVRAQAPDPPPPIGGPPPLPPPVPPPGDPYNPGAVIDRPLNHSFWDKCKEWITPVDHGSTSSRAAFQSDHCFDFLASPVSNPFFFEDPRSLTELRPIFIYQSAPGSNPIFHGGHSEFFGTQARLAFTDRLSFVINEFGFVSLHPGAPTDPVTSHTGFAEVHLGPKWTFLRNDQSGTIAAAGLTFEVPSGSGRVFQNTGNMGLDPYLTVAQSARLPGGFGSFNFMGEIGYSFGVDSQRSEFFHTSLHMDYDIANAHRWYPLIELNWFHYTKGGRRTDLGFEGADLVNFGSSSLGDKDFITLATGLRYKFSECIQTGIVFEWPLTRQKELTDFRVTFDVIFRY